MFDENVGLSGWWVPRQERARILAAFSYVRKQEAKKR
jgi:hypothetical protein